MPEKIRKIRRRPQPRAEAGGLWFIAIALAAAAVVAGVAFSGSWQHQYELSVRLGQAHWVAGMQPLSVEGLIIGATLVIWYAARYGHGWPWGAYLVLAVAAGQTVLMNLGAGSPWRWLGPEISVWPAVAFVAGYEMAVWMVRKRQDAGREDAAPVPDARPASPARRRPPAKAQPPDAAEPGMPSLRAVPDAVSRPGGPVHTPGGADPNERGRAAYAQSVASGRPLSHRALGEMFGRSKQWGADRVREVREAAG